MRSLDLQAKILSNEVSTLLSDEPKRIVDPSIEPMKRSLTMQKSMCLFQGYPGRYSSQHT
jgi:hypothetical protein